MFNIKLEEKSYEITSKLYWLKYSGQKPTGVVGNVHPPTTGADRVNHGTKFLDLNETSKAALRNRSSEVKF